MNQSNVKTPGNIIYRQDYQQPDYWLRRVELHFDIGAAQTKVVSKMHFENNPATNGGLLVLDGKQLKTHSVSLQGRLLDEHEYQLTAEQLTLGNLPDEFTLEIEVEIYPANNTALEGLYQSADFLLTQCEAEGFRKITWYPDRPDVMAIFTVTITADKNQFPVLLSNGNPVSSEDVGAGRHRVVWQDPHPKPAYLFALVAGDLEYIEDSFTTASGREVCLRIYVEKENINHCGHALESLIKSMQWDEQNFGLEYDLDHYNIVATSDFTMGAMENKGLNIFNTKYVLASAETATDTDFQGVEGVIAHEYFHNWTGNRVTCRDWFQLTLKEGLTVYRDQEFSSDMQSRSVKLIEDVRYLRNLQYPEDAGPMAHPIRPEKYQEISNFYTNTVYRKGAQVVGMYATLLGRDGFRAGMDLYFQRHDGQAVSCDDFLAAMADANNYDLDLFSRWYWQSGTPVVSASGEYCPQTREYRLTLEQATPVTADQENKQNLLIPFRMGLLSKTGKELELSLQGYQQDSEGILLLLKKKQQTFVFTDVPEPPVPSLLRGFSAPVKLDYAYSEADLVLLMAADKDDFMRWEASVRLALMVIKAQLEDPAKTLSKGITQAFRALLENQSLDPALVAEALSLPTEAYIAEQMPVIDVDAIHLARKSVEQQLGSSLQREFKRCYQAHNNGQPYDNSASSIGYRALKNRCLSYLAAAGDWPLVVSQLASADNMTDTMAALQTLVYSQHQSAYVALQEFYKRWQHDALVMDKWFAMQAIIPAGSTVELVKELLDHPGFALTNPNKVYALLGSFAKTNPVAFHRADGAGYRLFAKQVIKLDNINPQVAARMVSAFNQWRRYDAQRQQLMQTELERIAATAGLSTDVSEIVSNALRSACAC